jgi:uncharacterized membrane protein YraQ (UPF0718 family)
VRNAGASKGATAAFLVATPETGVDSISYSFAVLGPIYAIARPVAALLSAVVAGGLVLLMDKQEDPVPPQKACGGCCGGKAETVESIVATIVERPSLRTRLKAAVRYGYVDMIADTGKWLAIGLGVAALLTTYVPEAFFLAWGDGVLAMLAMVIVGLPMYICATASTPMAAGFLFAGMSPGAALVFLLTGPATNIATMGVIRAQLGMRSLIAYLLGVIGTAVVCGLLLNQLFVWFDWSLAVQAMEHGEQASWWRQLLAGVLLLLLVNVQWRRWWKPQSSVVGLADGL